MFTEHEKKICRNIQGLRSQAGFTQEEMASHLQLYGMDISRSSLARAEIGQRHLRPDELVIIKEALGITFEQLFGQIDHKTRDFQ